MKYRVEFTETALKDLKKMDRHTASLILGWIRKNLEGCENPRLHGKALTANKSGQWRYRIGDYRVLAEIQDEKITILVLTVGHRREIYN
ncbi:MAG: type II toxin-antitoxin system RelE/ParE family toxin [Clostridia bacterium]|nr:type II toxin-antitoxin system RelE/ParE family toxin [Clostridia bacterium]